MLSIVQYLMLSDLHKATFQRVLDTDCRVDARAYAQHARQAKDREAWYRLTFEDQERVLATHRG
jgi:hypothetical protein